MQDSLFFKYITSLLQESGHMVTSTPLYFNHSSSETLYMDSRKDVILSKNDRTLLATIDNTSLIMEIEWPSIIDELSEKVQIYSVTVCVSNSSRSQDVADIHFLLQQFWTNNHSIVFFKNNNQFIISFANETHSHILSEWYDIINDYDKVVEQISVANIKFDDCSTYFDDFIYSIARDYYINPISFENASYCMIPIDLFSTKLELNPLTIPTNSFASEYIKEPFYDNQSYYETIYGYDYVAVQYIEINQTTSHLNISNEIDQISFELDFPEEYSNTVNKSFDFSTEDRSDEADNLLDELDEKIDPAIFENPLLMVKWLEKMKQDADNVASIKLERLEAERLEAEHTSAIERIKQQYDTKLSLLKQRLSSTEARLDVINTTLSKLNILQFMKKKKLKNEQANLNEDKKQIIATIHTVSNKYISLLNEEIFRYNNAKSMSR